MAMKEKKKKKRSLTQLLNAEMPVPGAPQPALPFVPADPRAADLLTPSFGLPDLPFFLDPITGQWKVGQQGGLLGQPAARIPSAMSADLPMPGAVAPSAQALPFAPSVLGAMSPEGRQGTMPDVGGRPLDSGPSPDDMAALFSATLPRQYGMGAADAAAWDAELADAEAQAAHARQIALGQVAGPSGPRVTAESARLGGWLPGEIQYSPAEMAQVRADLDARNESLRSMFNGPAAPPMAGQPPIPQLGPGPQPPIPVPVPGPGAMAPQAAEQMPPGWGGGPWKTEEISLPAGGWPELSPERRESIIAANLASLQPEGLRRSIALAGSPGQAVNDPRRYSKSAPDRDTQITDRITARKERDAGRQLNIQAGKMGVAPTLLQALQTPPEARTEEQKMFVMAHMLGPEAAVERQKVLAQMDPKFLLAGVLAKLGEGGAATPETVAAIQAAFGLQAPDASAIEGLAKQLPPAVALAYKTAIKEGKYEEARKIATRNGVPPATVDAVFGKSPPSFGNRVGENFLGPTWKVLDETVDPFVKNIGESIGKNFAPGNPDPFPEIERQRRLAVVEEASRRWWEAHGRPPASFAPMPVEGFR